MQFRLIPEDPKQAHRLRRFFYACAGAAVTFALLVFYLFAGMIELGPLLAAASATVFLTALFYAVLRSGLNLRARDPSLTGPMIVASTLVLLYVIDQAPEGRPLLLLAYLVPFLFGVFRLNTAQMLAMAGLFMAGYGWILWQDWRAAEAMGALRGLVLQWLVPAVVLCWFALFSGYVSRMRKRLADSNSKLAAALQQVQSMMSRDEVSGLYTRRHMMEVLDREKRRSDRSGTRFCICMIDLDYFKVVNDTHGHAAGDEVLKSFGTTMLPVLRPGDVLGRFGGDEFLLVCADTPLEGAQSLAERVRRAMEQMRLPGMPQGSTLSLGVAQYQPRDSIEALLGRADAALYAAKQGGRNRVEVARALQEA